MADDVQDMRYLWRLALQEDHMLEVVGEASDGHAALEAVRTLKPDVLVLDLAMPGLDGLQVLAAVRRQQLQTQVVVASAFSVSRFGPLVTELGAAGYFEKGGSAADLRAMVKAAWRGSAGSALRCRTRRCA